MNITICLITCGEETEQDCLARLPKTGYIFNEVRNVYPQAAANNRATETTTTKYLVPLDSDMFLYEGFLDRINAKIEALGSLDWYQIAFPLWDVFFQKKILGLKVLDVAFMKRHPYQNTRVPDTEHYYRLIAREHQRGFKYVNLFTEGEPPIGDHVIRGNRVTYLKLKDNYASYRQNFQYDGFNYRTKVQEDYKFFLERYKATGNDDYLYAIAGMMDGIKNPVNQSKDFREEMRYSPEEAMRFFGPKKWFL